MLLLLLIKWCSLLEIGTFSSSLHSLSHTPIVYRFHFWHLMQANANNFGRYAITKCLSLLFISAQSQKTWRILVIMRLVTWLFVEAEQNNNKTIENLEKKKAFRVIVSAVVCFNSYHIELQCCQKGQRVCVSVWVNTH